MSSNRRRSAASCSPRADDALAAATTRFLDPLDPAQITQLMATLTRLLGAHHPAHWRQV
ncbi:hypothetical protein [Microbispora sp. NPDC046933]|uniref:hypothetical protein n=1 Tax=Microbispora sp. NPDC046933 TaxID=3155618 RepID=UPI0033CBB7BC